MRAINSSIMKQMNRKLILDCIRRQPISRAELSDRTRLTRASITQIVDELMADGLVAESAVVGRKQLGRRLTQLAIVSNAKYIIGVNLSRLQYNISIINLGGETLLSETGGLTGRDVIEVVDEICARIHAALSGREIPQEKIMGVGLCAPGPLDARAGKILNPPNFAPWHGAAIADWMEKRLGMRPTLQNIANARVLDELYFGIGRENVENFMLLHVDEGVSAGFVLKNRLFTGPQGQSLEVGHVSLDRNGPLCACGNRGCLERYIAFPDVLKNTPFAAWSEVVERLDTDERAQELFNHVADLLAFQIVNIINLLNLEKTVLSGEFVCGGERLAALVNQKICGRSLRTLDDAPVVAGKRVAVSRIAAMPAYHEIFAQQS